MTRIAVLAMGALAAGLASLTGIVPGATAAPASPAATSAPVALSAPAAPAAPAAPVADSSALTVFAGEVSSAQFGALTAAGIDRAELSVTEARAKNRVGIEVILSPQQAVKLRAQGLGLTEKRIGGQSVSSRLRAQSASGHEVFRSYSAPGGIKDEMIQIARANPTLTKLVVIGKTVQGKDIVAIKLTKNARRVQDATRPAVIYSSAQHAREWITPEMNRRLLKYYLKSYKTDPKIRKIVDRTELWFLPVANPDGYDFSFTEGNRLWRKNLRDNDRDRRITGGDGVDLNRNFPANWGYDNEGSSPDPASEIYRGRSPASEPETRAFDRLMRTLKPTHLVNYHAAGELLLYGTSWQVATPSPDDLILAALAGTDARPAVAGYDPDLSAELYTANGETGDQARSAYGVLAYTLEMSTCQTVSALDPEDAFEPADCDSVFNFPDSETLVQAEFQKNIPFAVSIAASAIDPDDPVTVSGRTAPDFRVDRFSVSYGNPQTVAVTARRALRNLKLNYSINGGRTRQAVAKEWRGGKRYGDTGDKYYAEFRGQVRGTRVGDQVKVWFTGSRAKAPGGRVTTRRSSAFTYTLAQDSNAKVLVVANEDYEGTNPTYPASVTAPKYAQDYIDALKAAGLTAVTWDVTRLGSPHHLGVLGHFDAVVWYLGDNRLTQDPEDEQIDFLGSQSTDLAVAERQQHLTLSLRDYLNEGGKLLHSGETAAYYGRFGSQLGGIYYGLDSAPEQECVVTEDPLADCLLLADDFSQYYLGAYGRVSIDTPTEAVGTGAPLTGLAGLFGGPAATDNPLNEPGSFTVTSDVLPVAQFPDFASSASGIYRGAAGGAFDPVQGRWFVGGRHTDGTYTRLARTVDLTATDAAQAPSLDFAISYDTEPGYDHVIVEAHTVGRDDWTTLAERGGATDQVVPDDCGAGFLLAQHPFLLNYLTPGAETCSNTGISGSWNRLTGSSDGWQQLSFDLSAFTGKQVEVAITYVTDLGSGGAGVFVDDTRITVGGRATQAEGFETGLGAWSILGPPAGSPSTTVGFARLQALFSAVVTTPDTVLLGFGVEQLSTQAERADVLGRAARYLLE